MDYLGIKIDIALGEIKSFIDQYQVEIQDTSSAKYAEFQEYKKFIK